MSFFTERSLLSFLIELSLLSFFESFFTKLFYWAFLKAFLLSFSYWAFLLSFLIELSLLSFLFLSFLLCYFTELFYWAFSHWAPLTELFLLSFFVNICQELQKPRTFEWSFSTCLKFPKKSKTSSINLPNLTPSQSPSKNRSQFRKTKIYLLEG